MRNRVPIPWKLEAEMCEAFASKAREAGWTVYPETAGWDLLLVGDDHVQIGVQAKLRCNLDVIAQAAEPIIRNSNRPKSARGPDHIVVLVPQATTVFHTVCRLLGIVVIDARRQYDRRPRSCAYDVRLEFDAPSLNRAPLIHATRREFAGGRCRLPEFVPDVPAGVPSPIQLTDWKIKAIRMCALLRRRGWVTSADFKAADLSISRWTNGEWWLKANGEKFGRLKKYVASGRHPLPDEDHPEIAEQVRQQQEGGAA